MKSLCFAVSVLCLLSSSVNAFEFDWDGSIGKGEHQYIPAISNPLFNETPYITTEVRPIYFRQRMDPQASGLFGGSIHLIAAEIRLALTDNLGIIATKDGYAWIDFDGTSNTVMNDPEGVANLALGLKYAFHNDIANKSIASVGVKYEPPTGTLTIGTKLPHPLDDVDLNSSGDGFINVFLSGAKRYDKLGLQGSIGVNAAIDGDHDSSMIHYSLHADYEVYKNIFPMIEFNGFSIYDEGNRTPPTTGALAGLAAVAGFDGVDLVNVGCSQDCGTVLTAAGGVRFVATDNLMFGLGVESSIAREDLLDWRGYFDAVIHF